MMSNFRISTRLYFLVGLALAIFTAAAVYKLYDSHDAMVAERKAKLNALDENVISLFRHFHELETSGVLTREEAQARAIDAVRPMRYEESGYFWINDMSNMMIMHPLSPALENTDLSELQGCERQVLLQRIHQGGQSRPRGLRRLSLGQAGRRGAGSQVLPCRGLRALGLDRRHRRLCR
tara:strand:+ start:69 stop:605 length:537 start_codon:yes stop_codon:yes gene_type:complete